MMVRSNSPVRNCHVNSNDAGLGIPDGAEDPVVANGCAFHSLSIFNSKQKLLNAPPENSWCVALSLHYANVIIIIEKLVASPH